jgi:uncharacterized membrane protein YfcA
VKTLKYICLFTSLICVAGALTGIRTISITPSGVTLWHYSTYAPRISAFANAVVLATFAYGIHIRARVMWKVGFLLLALGYICFVVGALTATYHAASVPSIAPFWVPAASVVLLGGVVTIYWGLWWKRQHTYFR